jgi:hypothetical protein
MGYSGGTLGELMGSGSRGYDVYLVSLIRYAGQRVCCGAPLTNQPSSQIYRRRSYTNVACIYFVDEYMNGKWLTVLLIDQLGSAA